MARENSVQIRHILDSQRAKYIYDFAIITLPTLPGELSPTILYVATANITVNGQVYTPTLKQVGKIQYTMGASPDQSSIQLENVRRVYGQLMMNPVRTLDGAKIKIFRAFRTGVAGGGYEADELMTGYLRDIKTTREDVKCAVVSDRSMRGSRVANKKITQRCRKVYSNLNGIYNPLSDCGWLLEMGVDLVRYPEALTTDCDLTPDGPNGCKAHRNRHRFGGVVETLPPDFYTGSGGTIPTGGGYGGCFLEGSPVILADGFTTRAIEKFHSGLNRGVGTLVASMDYSGNREKMRHGRVADSFDKYVSSYYELHIADKKFKRDVVIRSSMEQPFYRGKDFWSPAADLEKGESIYRFNPETKRFYKVFLLEKVIKRERVRVLNFRIEPWETYLVDFFPVHNNKLPSINFRLDPDYIVTNTIGFQY